MGLPKKPEVGELPHGAPADWNDCSGGVPHMLLPAAELGKPEYEVWSEGGAAGKPNPIGSFLSEPCCCMLDRRSGGSGMSSASSSKALLPK